VLGKKVLGKVALTEVSEDISGEKRP
ncbi:MAG: hypothetical protein ACI92B_002296, partial [Marinobacter maritimus]